VWGYCDINDKKGYQMFSLGDSFKLENFMKIKYMPEKGIPIFILNENFDCDFQRMRLFGKGENISQVVQLLRLNATDIITKNQGPELDNLFYWCVESVEDRYYLPASKENSILIEEIMNGKTFELEKPLSFEGEFFSINKESLSIFNDSTYKSIAKIIMPKTLEGFFNYRKIITERNNALIANTTMADTANNQDSIWEKLKKLFKCCGGNAGATDNHEILA
jgi:hypothetical protein